MADVTNEMLQYRIKQLEKQHEEDQKRISLLEEMLNDFSDQIAKLKEAAAHRDEDNCNLLIEISRLQAGVGKYKRMIFGNTSEQITADEICGWESPEESCDDEAAGDDQSDNSSSSSESAGRKKKKHKPRTKTKKSFRDIPAVERKAVYGLSAELISKYGDSLEKIGVSYQRTRIQWVTGHYEKILEYETVYKVKGQKTDRGNDLLVRSVLPKSLLPKSPLTASVMAMIIRYKLMGVPLRRQEAEFGFMGIYFPASTTSRWVIKIWDTYLKYVMKVFYSTLVSVCYIMGDETHLQVLKVKGQKPQKQNWLWGFLTGRSEKVQMVYYEYRQDRKYQNAVDILGDYDGALQCDDWGAYDRLQLTKIFRDWTHARRRFYDIWVLLPESAQNDHESVTAKCLDLIGKLFHIEDKLDPEEMSWDEITRYRQKYSKPIVDEYFALIKKSMPYIGKSTKLYDACKYSLNIEDDLRRFLDDGRIEITTNRIERMQKNFAKARKAFEFSDTEDGARALAAIFSINETAKLNHLIPEAYWNYLLSVLPYRNVTDPGDIMDLMPWSETLPKELYVPDMVKKS